MDSRAAEPPSAGRGRLFLYVPLGALIGTAAAMCGIGGGLFVVPLLHYGLRLPLRTSIGTSLLFILPTALSASVAEALRPAPAWDLRVVAALFAGMLLGIQLGYRFSRWVPRRGLKLFFTVALTLAALRLLFGGAAGASGASGGELVALGAPDLCVGLVTGIAGGFVAPLLGIGGGLVMVPSLSLGIPVLGFAGARACSLLVACFSSARSGWLYRKEGAMRVDLGFALGAGAVFGAAFGVHLIHQPGWVDGARIAMAVILGIVAVRFGFEAAGPAPSATRARTGE